MFASSSSTLEALSKPHVFPFEPPLPSRPSAMLLPPPFDPIHFLLTRQTSDYGNARITEDLRRNFFYRVVTSWCLAIDYGFSNPKMRVNAVNLPQLYLLAY